MSCKMDNHREFLSTRNIKIPNWTAEAEERDLQGPIVNVIIIFKYFVDTPQFQRILWAIGLVSE